MISNFTKGETFFISYNNQVLLVVTLRCALSLLHPQKMFFHSPTVRPRREYTLIWGRAYWLDLKAARALSIPTGRAERGW